MALKLGLLQEKISEAERPPRSSLISASVKGSLKKSRSSRVTSLCERNSLALRQVDHRAHQYRVALLAIVSSFLIILRV